MGAGSGFPPAWQPAGDSHCLALSQPRVPLPQPTQPMGPRVTARASRRVAAFRRGGRVSSVSAQTYGGMKGVGRKLTPPG